MMTKSEMMNILAEKTQLKKKDAVNAYDVLKEIIAKSLKKEKKFKLPDLGIFVIRRTKDRMVRNPKTGEMMKVKAKTVVRFRVAKALKDTVL